MRKLMIGVGLMCLTLEGCIVWPFMTDTLGHRSIEQGKQDQVFYWNAPQPIVLSSDYGQSFRQARDNQILNLDASENLDIVTGLEGGAGVLAYKRYQKFFKTPPFMPGKSGGSGKK